MIKLRAWHRGLKKMYQVLECYWDKNGNISDVSFKDNDPLGYQRKIPIKWFEIMQYTGLLDKYGNPICEGDVVSCGKHVSGYSNLPQVVELKDYMSIHYGLYFSPFSQKGFDIKETEIIGNIFENKEFIKLFNDEYSSKFTFHGMEMGRHWTEKRKAVML